MCGWYLEMPAAILTQTGVHFQAPVEVLEVCSDCRSAGWYLFSDLSSSAFRAHTGYLHVPVVVLRYTSGVCGSGFCVEVQVSTVLNVHRNRKAY